MSPGLLLASVTPLSTRPRFLFVPALRRPCHLFHIKKLVLPRRARVFSAILIVVSALPDDRVASTGLAYGTLQFRESTGPVVNNGMDVDVDLDMDFINDLANTALANDARLQRKTKAAIDQALEARN